VRRRLEHGQAEISDRFVQASREDAVPVVNKVLVGTVKSNDLPQLLQGPCRSRVRRHGDPHNSAAAVFDDHEHVEQSECRRDRHEEVTGDDRARTCSVPADQRLGPNHDQGIAPIEEPGKHRQRHPRRGVNAPRF
jgi:hypothetical protein